MLCVGHCLTRDFLELKRHPVILEEFKYSGLPRPGYEREMIADYFDVDVVVVGSERIPNGAQIVWLPPQWFEYKHMNYPEHEESTTSKSMLRRLVEWLAS